jgi:hypothetical protein
VAFGNLIMRRGTIMFGVFPNALTMSAAQTITLGTSLVPSRLMAGAE